MRAMFNCFSEAAIRVWRFGTLKGHVEGGGVECLGRDYLFICKDSNISREVDSSKAAETSTF